MERIEIHPATWKIVLMIAGMIAFIIGGIFMIIYGDSVYEKAIGVIGIVFFGGFGGYALYSRSRGQGKLAILPTGIEIGIPGVNPRVLPWSDIEAFGINKIANQEFTTIKLKSYQAWLSGISQEEATAAVRFFRSLEMLGQTTAKIAVANDEHPGAIRQMLDGSEEVKSLIDILAHNRAKFGAEFQLGWNMRDRSAKEFAEFLEQCRRNSK
ncbi:hypothetical protein BH20ACI4_BH20ACI4_18060 [soil metagenome]